MGLLRNPGTQQQWADTPAVRQPNRNILLIHSPALEAPASENLKSLLRPALNTLLYLCHQLCEHWI